MSYLAASFVGSARLIADGSARSMAMMKSVRGNFTGHRPMQEEQDLKDGISPDPPNCHLTFSPTWLKVILQILQILHERVRSYLHHLP